MNPSHTLTVTCNNQNFGVEISIHPPSAYVQEHLQELLPNWQKDAISVIIFLQQAQMSLTELSPEVEAEKQRLWDNFSRWSDLIASELGDRGYVTDAFDPRTGYPRRSQPGTLHHSDVPAVHAALGYPIEKNGDCAAIVHPHWGTAVYPSVMISTAPADEIINAIIKLRLS
ncbi:methylmalonic aciduria and homocystinuria type D protein [Roseofilum sp. BLCC_M154]|uniref:Methylmalonic aciduria and homocystinuria type D protein n=1 Tax=Roseofilum acuticapitatum BLCC-M154 TaxID=3022444 RepID=A0ABT7AP03_9CYAN|nr:methylmalonic aciduria and homocystinuria type D protein [Roseofilum acuticapitatum]MDJ1168628.1 methylmalonic aciduria and homocystinuria type D protein [Roseofilum acuticapitatum BLCC-M154]